VEWVWPLWVDVAALVGAPFQDAAVAMAAHHGAPAAEATAAPAARVRKAAAAGAAPRGDPVVRAVASAHWQLMVALSSAARAAAADLAPLWVLAAFHAAVLALAQPLQSDGLRCGASGWVDPAMYSVAPVCLLLVEVMQNLDGPVGQEQSNLDCRSGAYLSAQQLYG